MTTDRSFVEGIKFHGFHGLTELERQVGVRVRKETPVIDAIVGAVGVAMARSREAAARP